MKKKHIRSALAAATAVIVLTGCGAGSFHPDQSGIYVKKDGTLRFAEVESFDNSAFAEDRYQEAELLTFVEDTVSAYNQEASGQAGAYKKDADGLKVTIDSLEVKSNTAKLILNYASVEDYLEFNEGGDSITTLSIQNAPDAVSAGILLDGLKDAEGNVVDTAGYVSNEKCCVVTISGSTELTVAGKILGVSDGVTIEDKNTVMVDSVSAVTILFK